MLQKLNERIQGVVAWVVIILITFTFALFGIDYYLQTHNVSNVQIEVNGYPISKQDFEVNYRRARQMRDPSQMTTALEAALKQQIIDEMIVNSVSQHAARSHGFEVSPAQANSAILSIPQFQQDGHFSKDKYQQALTGALFTPETFQKEVRQGMLLNQQRFSFIGTSFALPNEIQKFVKLYMQSRSYEYLRIPALRFMKEASVSPEEIEAYYQQHQKDFLAEEEVSIQYVQLSLADIKDKIQIPDQQIKRYYEENQSNYYTPTQWQVAHILLSFSPNATIEEQELVKKRADSLYKRLQENPQSFESEMKTLSADKISITNKGVLPWIIAGQSEFDKALIDLKKSGQLSPPVKSEHGYEIFKLLAYKPATVKPLSQVKSEIKEQLAADMAQTKYNQAQEQLSDLSYQTPDALTPVAQALNLTIQQSTPFSRQGGDTELSKNKQVVNAAFSHDVLELGNNSEPIQLNNENIIVLRVNQHIPPSQKPMAEVRALIVEKLALLKAKAEARQLGKRILAVYLNSLAQEQLINENKMHWQAVNVATRDTDTNTTAINEMAFSMQHEGSESGRSLPNGDYVIVHLKKINEGNLDALDKEQIASISQQIEASYGTMDYDLYIKELMDKAQVIKH